MQHTRWSPAQGRVSRGFVDVLATGVSTPDADLFEKLGRWSTTEATGYQPEYLAGFDSSRYDIDADEQRVDEMATADQDVLFRLLLLPLWIAIYITGGKTLHVYVNANTGEVIGERPYSAVKIVAAVMAALAVIAAALSPQ